MPLPLSQCRTRLVTVLTRQTLFRLTYNTLTGVYKHVNRKAKYAAMNILIKWGLLPVIVNTEFVTLINYHMILDSF